MNICPTCRSPHSCPCDPVPPASVGWAETLLGAGFMILFAALFIFAV